MVGQSFSLTCQAYSRPLAVIKWMKDFKALKMSDRIRWTNTSSHYGIIAKSVLTIGPTVISDKGVYYCVAITTQGEKLYESVRYRLRKWNPTISIYMIL